MPEMMKRGWRTWRFDQMAVMVNDRIDNPSEAGVDRYVGLEHLDSASLTMRRWGAPSDVEATKLRFRAGDIIFGRRRVYQRKLGVADFDGICSAHAMVLRALTDVVLPEFLPFFMQSELFMERAKQISVGSLSPTINWKTLAAEKFALPPLEEQRRIAEVLKGIQHLVEAYQDVINRSANLLAATSYTRFSQLSKQPHGTLRPLGDLLQKPIANGIFRTRDQFGSGMKLVNVTDCYKGFRVPVDSLERVPVSAAEYESFSALPGDVIFNRSSLVEAGIGHACLVPAVTERLVFECHLMRVRPDSSVLIGAYLTRYALSPIGRRYLLGRAQTTTMTTIGQSDLVAMPLPCNNIETQSRVVEELDSIERSGELASQRLGEICALKDQLLRSIWASNGGDHE